MAIPKENIAVFLQKFTVTAPTANAFSALYNSVGVFTTNVPNARQWQFTFNGNFTSLEKFEIIYDFSKVNTFGYSIKFEGGLNGFLTVDKQIYACDRYIKYIPQTEEDIKNKIVRLLFKPPCSPPELVNRSLYYVVNLNDTSCKACADSNTTISEEGDLPTPIDVETINSGNLTSTFSYKGTTICGHKNIASGTKTTVVFLYFTEINISKTSYWAITNIDNDWVVQFENLTTDSSGNYAFNYSSEFCNGYKYDVSDIGTNSYTFTTSNSCFTTSTTIYTDPYPITEC